MNDIEKAQIRAVITTLSNLLIDTPAAEPVITTEQEFEAGLADVSRPALFLDPSFVYTKPLTITRKLAIINQGIANTQVVRAQKTDIYPIFREGITIKANEVYLAALDIRRSDTDVILNIDGAIGVKILQCKILGDPIKGNKRGIRANGGNMSITKCYIADIKRVAQDTQAIFTSSMTAPGLYIEDCYLEGAAEAFMAGGEDPATVDQIPSQITILNSTLTKNPAWFAEGQQIKNAFELKNARKVIVRNCILEYAGISQGQGAFLFLMTVRNQGGKAPFSIIEDVLVQNCTARFGGGCISFLGMDNVNPSGQLNNVVFDNIHFTDIDPHGITKGAGRAFLFGAAPKGVTLQNITIEGANLTSIGYFNKPAPVGLTLKNIKVPVTKYDWKIDAGGFGIPALKVFMPDADIQVTPTDTGSSL